MNQPGFFLGLHSNTGINLRGDKPTFNFNLLSGNYIKVCGIDVYLMFASYGPWLLYQSSQCSLLKNKCITILVSECCSLKYFNSCEDSDSVVGRQHLLMYSMHALKYTRIVQVPHGTIHFSRQHNEQKVSMGKWVPSVTLLWKLRAELWLE
jgi:hypothetical protein